MAVVLSSAHGTQKYVSPRSTTMVGVLSEEGIDHCAVAMKDPEGNEFDIN